MRDRFTIWKFPFEVADNVRVMMPQHAKILDVQEQGGQACIWAVVDEDAPQVEHLFQLRGTGHPLGSVGAHIATFQLGGGRLVFHLFHEGF